MRSRFTRVPVAGSFLMAALLLALALIFTGGVGGSRDGGPQVANAGCGNLRAQVEVVSRFPKPFASQYKKKLRIQVFNRTRNVKRWHAELYTFSGFRLGKSKPKKWLRWGDRTAIKLRQSMQPGKYTVVLKGKILRCGKRETSDVVNLRGCLNQLPVRFPNKPGGNAADYNAGGYVSVGIEPRSDWAPIKKIKSTLLDFNGTVYGRAELPRGSRNLIGRQFLDHELTRELTAQQYTVLVEGKAPQPRSCGDKTKSTVLTFK
jgi:hypothetical protein